MKTLKFHQKGGSYKSGTKKSMFAEYLCEKKLSTIHQDDRKDDLRVSQGSRKGISGFPACDGLPMELVSQDSFQCRPFRDSETTVAIIQGGLTAA